MSKFALCIGINYKGTGNQLMGCASDAERIKEHLTEEGFQVVMLCDDSKMSNGSPTRKNIVDFIKTLVINANNNHNSSVVFTYSGHGASIRDQNGDEKDGMDELIVTVDNEYVTDDEFFRHFISKLNKDVSCFCMFDACHSGTMLDLKYKHSKGENTIEHENAEVCSDVISISGCKDNECSLDIKLSNIEYSGAMTFAFFKCYDKEKSFIEIVKDMRKILKDSGYPQYPELTMSKEELVNEKVNKFI